MGLQRIKESLVLGCSWQKTLGLGFSWALTKEISVEFGMLNLLSFTQSCCFSGLAWWTYWALPSHAVFLAWHGEFTSESQQGEIAETKTCISALHLFLEVLCRKRVMACCTLWHCQPSAYSTVGLFLEIMCKAQGRGMLHLWVCQPSAYSTVGLFLEVLHRKRVMAFCFLWGCQPSAWYSGSVSGYCEVASLLPIVQWVCFLRYCVGRGSWHAALCDIASLLPIVQWVCFWSYCTGRG